MCGYAQVGPFIEMKVKALKGQIDSATSFSCSQLELHNFSLGECFIFLLIILDGYNWMVQSLPTNENDIEE